MKCIPFDSNFTWAPEHNNLYDWGKSLNLGQINYFWGDDSENSHGYSGSVYLRGNDMDSYYNRYPIHNPSGSGLIYDLALLIHEISHAKLSPGHNCGYDDTNLEYGGAWAIQYYFMSHLANHTGDYFSDYEQKKIKFLATYLYENNFCDYN